MATLFKDDDFLCEKCGYVLNGLGAEANCSECGKPAYESHPERRVGNAWQKKASVVYFFYTLLRTPLLFSFFGIFERVAIRPSRVFEAVAILIMSSVVSITYCIMIYFWYKELSIQFLYMAMVVFVFSFLLTTGAVYLLNFIEMSGIRFFGTRRGWRITKRNAVVITSYATSGWLVGWVASSIAAIMGIYFSSGGDWQSSSRVWYQFSLLGFYVMPWLVGMLWFETLVYIGMRRMKFANPPEAAPPWSIEDALRARGELPPPSGDASPATSPSGGG
jgi:hypothetical protein